DTPALLSETQKGLVGLWVIPHGFTRWGSKFCATPSWSETRFVWMTPPLTAAGAPTYEMSTATRAGDELNTATTAVATAERRMDSLPCSLNECRPPADRP